MINLFLGSWLRWIFGCRFWTLNMLVRVFAKILWQYHPQVTQHIKNSPTFQVLYTYLFEMNYNLS
jgi:hypothetical protein